MPPLSSFRRRVMDYWRKAGRHDLPWRQTTDPYAILVSEMMLQQTQVYRVIPFYTRFLRMFPTPRALAEASRADVLAAWNGLGYNRRAVFLHEAAKAVVRQGGVVPRGYQELRGLSGVGDYTAKAIRVFAYDEPESLIETNVRAVFIHHFFPRGRSVSDARLMPFITGALRGNTASPRQWYAALMDYGTHLKAMQGNPSRRSRHHVRQSAFTGSGREVRGAIVRALVEGTSIDELRRRFGARLEPALAALEKEGIIERDGRHWRLAR